MTAHADKGNWIQTVHLTKRFGSNEVVRSVSFGVRLGEVHAVVGQNGAGKSTVMHLLFGMLQPDQGSIQIKGREVRLRSPRQAIAASIGMVHQHFSLAPGLSVLENIVLGAEPVRLGFIDRKKAEARVNAIAAQLGIALDCDAKVAALPVGVRQRVEIVKALYRGTELLILDEPTALLTPQESGQLLALLRGLAAKQMAVVLITHKLAEVMEVADRVSVMRQGSLVGTYPANRIAERQLAELIMGDQLPDHARSNRPAGDLLLSVRGVSTARLGRRVPLNAIDLTVRAGEITAVVAAAGNGETELFEALARGSAVTAGQILLRGREITHLPLADRMRAGLVVLPPDRHNQALYLAASIADNLRAGAVRRWWEWLLPPDRGLSEGAVAQRLQEFNLKGGGPATLVGALSGGNQQKVALARVLAHAPSVLLVANPTRGVDIASGKLLHDRIRQEAARGMGVLLFTYDLDEALSLADQTVVLYKGALAGTFRGDRVTIQDLGAAMLGLGEAVPKEANA